MLPLQILVWVFQLSSSLHLLCSVVLHTARQSHPLFTGMDGAFSYAKAMLIMITWHTLSAFKKILYWSRILSTLMNLKLSKSGLHCTTIHLFTSETARPSLSVLRLRSVLDPHLLYVVLFHSYDCSPLRLPLRCRCNGVCPVSPQTLHNGACTRWSVWS